MNLITISMKKNKMNFKELIEALAEHQERIMKELNEKEKKVMDRLNKKKDLEKCNCNFCQEFEKDKEEEEQDENDLLDDEFLDLDAQHIKKSDLEAYVSRLPQWIETEQDLKRHIKFLKLDIAVRAVCTKQIQKFHYLDQMQRSRLDSMVYRFHEMFDEIMQKEDKSE